MVCVHTHPHVSLFFAWYERAAQHTVSAICSIVSPPRQQRSPGQYYSSTRRYTNPSCSFWFQNQVSAPYVSKLKTGPAIYVCYTRIPPCLGSRAVLDVQIHLLSRFSSRSTTKCWGAPTLLGRTEPIIAQQSADCSRLHPCARSSR